MCSKDTKAVFEHYFECPKCFLNFSITREDKQEKYHELKLCEFCESHPNMTERELLDRHMEVILKTSVDKFPVIVKHLWEFLKHGMD